VATPGQIKSEHSEAQRSEALGGFGTGKIIMGAEILEGERAAQYRRWLLADGMSRHNAEVLARQQELSAAAPGRRWIDFQRERDISEIKGTYINARIGVLNCGLHCRLDTFHQKIIVDEFVCSEDGDGTGNLDNIEAKVRDRIVARFGFDPGKGNVHDAVMSVALANEFDPVREYLDGLRWDGHERIDRWVVDRMGGRDTPLNRAVGRKMLVAAVRRVRRPGCKFDYIPVFEGAQGSGRSTALKVMAGGEDNFSDAEIIMQAPKERQELIQGVWIYELAEMAGYGRVDVNKFKNFVSQTVDQARPAYGRNRVDRPRRCIFCGTINERDYLRDETGNRRYWPVGLRDGWRIDLERLAEVRDDLWAEAAAIEASGELLVIPEALWPAAAEEQAKRMQDDPWLGALEGLELKERGWVSCGVVDGSQIDSRTFGKPL
jgi:putative DNA primase/helicase